MTPKSYWQACCELFPFCYRGIFRFAKHAYKSHILQLHVAVVPLRLIFVSERTKATAAAARCFEIPGVIYHLGISSPPPFQVRVTTPAHFFFLLFVGVFFLSPPVPWLCRSNDMALRKQRREAEGLYRGNKQAIVRLPVSPLTRPPRMLLRCPGDVFRHTSLCVSNCPFTCLSISSSPV